MDLQACGIIPLTLSSSLFNYNTHTLLLVSSRLLRASLRSFRPPTSSIGQPSQTEYSLVSSQHIWHLGFQSSVWQVGTLCLIRCVIRPSNLNVVWVFENVSLPDIRHELIRGVTVSSNRAIQVDMDLLTYLLTHSFTHLVETFKVLVESAILSSC